VATHCNPIYNVNKIGSIGLPLPGVDCRIVDPEDGLTELGPGQPGELLIKGPQVMSSYFNRPELTREALRDGWLYTGDMARMDDEGYFYILDRKQDLIKVDGVRVWPREVEEALQKHPAIADAGVAGIPDGMEGDAVKAWVVLKNEQALTVDELRIWAQRNLPPHQCPLHWELVDEIPKTITGKVLRRKLLEAEAMASA
jgi:long-chain acyl-CoA synthetase